MPVGGHRGTRLSARGPRTLPPARRWVTAQQRRDRGRRGTYVWVSRTPRSHSHRQPQHIFHSYHNVLDRRPRRGSKYRPPPISQRVLRADSGLRMCRRLRLGLTGYAGFSLAAAIRLTGRAGRFRTRLSRCTRVPRSSSRRCSRRISPSTLPLTFIRISFFGSPGEHAFLESILALLDAWQWCSLRSHVAIFDRPSASSAVSPVMVVRVSVREAD